MRDENRLHLSGRVRGELVEGQTTTEPACYFLLRSVREGTETVTKVNAYGEGLVGLCRDRIKAGQYLSVSGELMNREKTVESGGKAKKILALEVRALNIMVIQQEAKPNESATTAIKPRP